MPLDRRAFLSQTGRLALGLAALPLLRRRGRSQPVADARNVELVTVTDTEAVLTFESELPSEALVRWGPSPEDLDAEVADPAGRTRFHTLRLTGLEPGTSISYEVRADGVAAETNDYSPGRFQTLTPPSGPLLFTFATINDLHAGLTSAGAVGGLSSFEPVECPLADPACWEVANRSVVQAINQTDAAFTIAKGDLSHEYRREEFEAVKEILDGLRNPYRVVRGNHDRQGEQPEDYFTRVFGLESTRYAFSNQGVRFIVLDSSNLQTGFPEIGDEQFEWLDAELRAAGDEKIVLVLHHAVTEEASIFFSLFTEDQRRLFSLLSRRKNLAAILSGHSHRNIVTHQAELGDTPCVETACTVHYPGGYHLHRVYAGGFMQTYHKIDGEEWRVWEEAGRAMYKGDAQAVLLGRLEDRNFIRRFDTPIPRPPEEPGGCGCSSPGGGTGMALAVALGGALAGRRAGEGKP